MGSLYEGLGLVDSARTRRPRPSPKPDKCPECDDATYYVGDVCAGCGYCDHCQRPG